LIYGAKVRLRAVERSDLPRYVAWLNDSEVRKGLAQVFPLSLAQEEKWFEGSLALPREEQPLAIEAQEGRGWVHIGGCSLFRFDRLAHNAELGIVIGEKSLWGKGYGTEAMRALIEHAFGTLNLHRVFLRVYESNARAIRVYQRIGFIEEGRFRQDHLADGTYEDTVIMGLLRTEWGAASRSGRAHGKDV
jgi:RimJ/RimL family protein N-acetyltransferase